MTVAQTTEGMSPGLLKVVERAKTEPEGRFHSLAHLIDVPDQEGGIAFGARLFTDPTTEYVRVFEVMRDYGMYERSEAPQYYPPVERHRP